VVVIFSYFFEAGTGLALGLTIGLLPGVLLLRWLLRKKQQPAALYGGVEKKQHKAVVTG